MIAKSGQFASQTGNKFLVVILQFVAPTAILIRFASQPDGLAVHFRFECLLPSVADADCDFTSWRPFPDEAPLGSTTVLGIVGQYCQHLKHIKKHQRREKLDTYAD